MKIPFLSKLNQQTLPCQIVYYVLTCRTQATVGAVSIAHSIGGCSGWAGYRYCSTRWAVVAHWAALIAGVGLCVASVTVVSRIAVTFRGRQPILRAELPSVAVHWVGGATRTVGSRPASPAGVVYRRTSAVGQVGGIRRGGGLGHGGSTRTVPACTTVTSRLCQSIT